MNREVIENELDRLFYDARCELNYTHDYELLLSVMLSAQTTDKSVNIVTGPLYSKYDSLEKLNTLSVSEIDKHACSEKTYRALEKGKRAANHREKKSLCD